MRAILLAATAAFGLSLAMVGLAATLNLLSIRSLLARLELWRLYWLAVRLHELISHRRVQGLELTMGLIGLALFGLVVVALLWWMSRHRFGTEGSSRRLSR